MRTANLTILSLALLAQAALSCPACAQSGKPSYPAMAPLSQYLMPDEASEIALARSAAPPSISDAAEVMVLRREGFVTAAKGSNGFLCIVERSWANPTGSPEFWNPRLRAPNCFNPAARSFVAIFLLKTHLVLAGKSSAEIHQAEESALNSKTLLPLEPGAMCYMMSRQQYLGDRDMGWHPHLMFFVSGDAEKTWGANLPGSPLLAGNDPEERVTIFLLPIGQWSDGTPAEPMH